MNMIGASTDPCGTPLVTSLQLDFFPLLLFSFSFLPRYPPSTSAIFLQFHLSPQASISVFHEAPCQMLSLGPSTHSPPTGPPYVLVLKRWVPAESPHLNPLV